MDELAVRGCWGYDQDKERSYQLPMTMPVYINFSGTQMLSVSWNQWKLRLRGVMESDTI